MASAVRIVSLTGVAPGTPTVITARRYSCIDQVDPGLLHAIDVPAEGLTVDSFWCHEGLEILASSPFSQLTNFRWGTNGINAGWGLHSGKMQVALRDTGDHGCPLANYQQAVGSDSGGTPIKDSVAGHLYYKLQSAALADADVYNTNTPLTYDSRVITFAMAPCYTYFVLSSLQVAHDTEFGEKSVLYNFFRWQEI